VLVTLDTLRADHVGAYGGDVATPHLDRLAREGALAEQVCAHVPLTRPSHVSLMSGRLPTETGVRDNVSPAAIPDLPLLAEVLRDAGFATAAFVSSVVVSAASGLDRGFGVYSDDFETSADDPSFLNTAQKRGDATLAEALTWIESQRDGSRLFLWLHLFDPHDPYEPPEPYASRYPGRPYAGEVAWTDELVGRLDAALHRPPGGIEGGDLQTGLAGDTLLVVTSDHGEGLGEHDEPLHGFFVYESTLRVPLIVRGPGVVPGTRLAGAAGLVDLYPTILELAGVAPPAGAELSGRSLAGALRGGAEPEPAPVYAESLVARLRFGWSDLRVVRDGRWKYVRAPRPELYDLADDPGETRNVADEHRPRVRALDDALGGFLARERPPDTGAQSLPPELLERLHALGYVGGASPAATATPGADPKDKIGEFRVANDLMRQGLVALHAEDFRASAARFEDLLGRGVDNAEVHLYLGRALRGLGRAGDAARHFQVTTERTPAYPEGWLGLAEARLRLGDADAALAALAAGQLVLPSHAGLKKEEGRLLGRLGKLAEARRALEAARALAPRDANLRAMLSEVLTHLGDAGAAVAELREAVAIEPATATYWNALGMALGGAGELGEAERAFREAWRLDASDPRYAYNLGLVLVRQGRAGEARPFFESVLALDPGFEPARERLAQIGRNPP
jgi:arylsulfatase A-like enzyme/Flp pilus assembly protein TadD